jgi:uncharacterized membrane protein
MKSGETLALSAAIGALAGLRTFTPPAILSQAARHNLISVRRSRFRFLRSPVTANIITALAVGELIGDKLPFTPSRLQPAALAVRAASGALCGAAISMVGSTGKSLTSRLRRGKTFKRNNPSAVAIGAVLGGLGAIGGAFAGYHLRRSLTYHLGAPDPAIAVIEDLVAIAGTVAIVSKETSILSIVSAGVL